MNEYFSLNAPNDAHQLKHARRLAKSKFYKRQAAELNVHRAKRPAELLFKAAKAYGNRTRAPDASKYIAAEKFATHFQKHFESEPRFDSEQFPPEIEHYGEGEYAYLKDIEVHI